MKIKQETVSNFLLLANLAVIISAIFLLQDICSINDNITILEVLKLSVEKTGLYLIILILIELSLFIALFFSSQKALNKSNEKRLPITLEEMNNLEKMIPTITTTLSKEDEAKNQFKIIQESIKEINKDSISLKKYCEGILSILAQTFEISQGIFYSSEINENNETQLAYSGGYAYFQREDKPLKIGEGLAGQVAKAKRIVNIKHIPDGYIKIISGLGEATPTNLLICPIIHNDKTIAIMELASFIEFSKIEEEHFTNLAQVIQEKIYSLQTNS
jgi:putative methionine-R-sulfoxide reductase with GAF domain